VRVEADKRQRDGDLAKAAADLYGRDPGLEKRAGAEAEAESRRQPTDEPHGPEEVGADDIAEVVSSGPASRRRLLQGETEKLLHMEEELGSA
jgi:ATP-dependent Clp protease ATP-binding subunit ClpB